MILILNQYFFLQIFLQIGWSGCVLPGSARVVLRIRAYETVSGHYLISDRQIK